MKTLVSTLFVLLVSIITFGQNQYLEYTSTTDPYLNTGKANGGEYKYKATVKCRASAPGLGDVRVQCSILSFEILSFEYDGKYYNRSEEGFPMVIDNIQSDLDVTFKFSFNSWSETFFSHKIYGVRKGAFDLAYLTDDEVKKLGLKTSKDFYDLGFSFSIESLTNTYFEELDNFKNGIKKDEFKKREIEKKQNQDDTFQKWEAEQKRKADWNLKVLESEARIEKEKREAAQKKKEYEDSFKSKAQKQHERDVKKWFNVFSSINNIDIRDADLESGSWGVSYSLNDFNETSLFYSHISAWDNFFFAFDFKATMLSYKAYESENDIDDYSDLLQIGEIHDGDLVIQNHSSSFNETSDRVYRQNKINSFGGNVGVGLGLRFNLSRATALRFLVMGDIGMGSELPVSYGYNFKTQLEIGAIILGISYNTTTYNFGNLIGDSEYLDIDKIVTIDQLGDNLEENTWATENYYNYDNNQRTYYTSNRDLIGEYQNFNKITQNYFQLSIAYKL
jgi:hypothetical protein